MRSVPGPCSRIASNRRSVSRLALRLQRLRPLGPRLARVVRVEPADVCDVLPEPLVGSLGLELRIDDLRPRPGRRGDDAPARRHPVHDLARLGKVGEEIAAGSRRIEPVERARRMRARERDAGGVLVREVEEPLRHPWRHVVERSSVGVRDALALQPLVEVEDVDVLRALLVRGARDLPRQRPPCRCSS